MIPRVSVVMPVHNGEAFVDAAVSSVLASVGVELELLLVDDGSTDGSVACAEAAAGGDPRLRVLRVPRGGVARARNAALRAARGEYVANADSDDITLPARLAMQVRLLDARPDLVAVGARCLAVDATLRPMSVLGRMLEHDEIDQAHLGLRGGALPNASALFRRSAATAVGGYDDRLTTVGEDMDFWLKLAEGGRLANLPDVLVLYRMHGENTSLQGASREDRAHVAHGIVERAHQRRGTGGPPVRVAAPPFTRSERAANRALLHHFRGRRVAAMLMALYAVLLHPSSAIARTALRAVAAGPPPWPAPPAVVPTAPMGS